MSLPADRFGAREAHDFAVEGLHPAHVAAEKPDRAVTHDLERPRQQDAVDVVLRRHRLRVAEARIEIDALRRALLHFLVLGHLRQGRGPAGSPPLPPPPPWEAPPAHPPPSPVKPVAGGLPGVGDKITDWNPQNPAPAADAAP